MHERLFTNESVSSRLEFASNKNTSQIFKRMVALVEMNSHRETLLLSLMLLLWLLSLDGSLFDVSPM